MVTCYQKSERSGSNIDKDCKAKPNGVGNDLGSAVYDYPSCL